MWKEVSEIEVVAEASFDIWVSKGPMSGMQSECSLYEGDWYDGNDLVAPASWVSHIRPAVKSIGPHDKIAGKTLAEWTDLSRRDDCFNQMVPGDLRAILQFIA